MIYNAAGNHPLLVIGSAHQTDKLEFTRRAGGQVVRKITVVVFALHRSVSFFRAQIGIQIIGFNKLNVKLEFVRA